ncbi:hypothetical protein K7H20_20825 [Salipiger manganoxidans]|uniref:hypothetical protein n=1 Tax=Salipiger marinus TaxID=555512 RepID=UPI001E5E0FDE|nr:hypothetical protein [Salipiger manganoxidans]MCD1620509.1 hypothetical protein [Salipiger manganoxidans]
MELVKSRGSSKNAAYESRTERQLSATLQKAAGPFQPSDADLNLAEELAPHIWWDTMIGGICPDL